MLSSTLGLSPALVCNAWEGFTSALRIKSSKSASHFIYSSSVRCLVSPAASLTERIVFVRLLRADPGFPVLPTTQAALLRPLKVSCVAFSTLSRHCLATSAMQVSPLSGHGVVVLPCCGDGRNSMQLWNFVRTTSTRSTCQCNTKSPCLTVAWSCDDTIVRKSLGLQETRLIRLSQNGYGYIYIYRFWYCFYIAFYIVFICFFILVLYCFYNVCYSFHMILCCFYIFFSFLILFLQLFLYLLHCFYMLFFFIWFLYRFLYCFLSVFILFFMLVFILFLYRVSYWFLYWLLYCP